MNDIHDDPLAQRARALHEASLDAVSPRVRAQLLLRRQAATAPARTPARGRDWRWAAAPALALALAFGLPRGVETPGSDASLQVAAAAVDSPAMPLEQDPEFYAWLASADALALASE